MRVRGEESRSVEEIDRARRSVFGDEEVKGRAGNGGKRAGVVAGGQGRPEEELGFQGGKPYTFFSFAAFTGAESLS